MKWFTPTFMLKFLIENSRILVVIFVSKLNFSFSFRFVDEKYRIFVIVVVFVMKINLFSSTKIFVFVVVDEKNTGTNSVNFVKIAQGICPRGAFIFHILVKSE